MKIFGDIESVRARVASLADDRPFALLPVRLETRFVEAEEWLVGPPVEGWYAAFAEIAAAFLSGGEPNFSNLAGRLRAVRQDILRHSGFTRAQKARLLELFGAMKKASDAFKTQPLAAEFLMEQAATESVLQNLPAEADATYLAARDVIREMENLLRSMRLIAAGQMPYSSPKNRKQLHFWLEGLMRDLRHFYREQDDKISFVKQLEKTQFDRIATLHEAIKQAAPTMPGPLFLGFVYASWETF